MYVHFLLFYTLIGSLSDDPEFACPDWMLSSIVQVFDETVHDARSWKLSFLDHRYSCSLSFLLFLDSLYSIISCHSISLFIYYHVWMLICNIAAIMIYYSKFL